MNLQNASIALEFTALLICTFTPTILAQSKPEPMPNQAINEVYTAKEVTRRAQVLKKPEPTIVGLTRSDEMCGVVKLRLVLNSSGKVTNVSVLQELPEGIAVRSEATEKAIAAANKIKFVPAEKDGRAVSQWINAEYNFNADCFGEGASVTHQVIILDQPVPEYTEEARKHKIKGTVTLRVIFMKNGEVLTDSVIDSLPYGLTEKAVEATRKIKFKPAEVDGHKISKFEILRYEFTLE